MVLILLGPTVRSRSSMNSSNNSRLIVLYLSFALSVILSGVSYLSMVLILVDYGKLL